MKELITKKFEKIGNIYQKIREIRIKCLKLKIWLNFLRQKLIVDLRKIIIVIFGINFKLVNFEIKIIKQIIC
jgi:hypothetical protein